MKPIMDEESFNEATRKIAHVFYLKLKLMEQKNRCNNCKATKPLLEEDAAAEDDEDEEFCFSRAFDETNMRPADEEAYFKPVFPLFNRDLLLVHATEVMEGSKGNIRLPNANNAFVIKMPLKDEIAGPICLWTGKKAEVVPECKKIKGINVFSRIWKFKYLMHKSKSDDRDELVFKKDLGSGQIKEKAVAVGRVEEKELPENVNGGKPKKVVKGKSSMLWAHENYICCRAREEDRRRAYLARRAHMIGVLTNIAARGTWTLSKES